MLTVSRNGQLLFNPKLDITNCELSFTDADGKSYPLALAGAPSLRLPFLSPEAMAAEMIEHEVTERKNADRTASGKNPVLSKAQRARNRRKAAAKKWRDEHLTKPDVLNVVFSDVVADARAAYIAENSETRINRKVAAAQKRRESGTITIPEAEAAVVQYRLLLSRLEGIPEAYDEVRRTIAELEEAIAKATDAKSPDIVGAAIAAATA
jgi:hypothetical protein